VNDNALLVTTRCNLQVVGLLAKWWATRVIRAGKNIGFWKKSFLRCGFLEFFKGFFRLSGFCVQRRRNTNCKTQEEHYIHQSPYELTENDGHENDEPSKLQDMK